MLVIWDRIFIALGTLVVGFVVGMFVQEDIDQEAIQEINRENERLRQQLRAVLGTFAAEDELSTQVIASVLHDPPQSEAELRLRLRTLSVSEVKIEKIIAAVRAAGIYTYAV